MFHVKGEFPVDHQDTLFVNLPLYPLQMQSIREQRSSIREKNSPPPHKKNASAGGEE
jgi:hypothetical protein